MLFINKGVLVDSYQSGARRGLPQQTYDLGGPGVETASKTAQPTLVRRNAATASAVAMRSAVSDAATAMAMRSTLSAVCRRLRAVSLTCRPLARAYCISTLKQADSI